VDQWRKAKNLVCSRHSQDQVLSLLLEPAINRRLHASKPCSHPQIQNVLQQHIVLQQPSALRANLAGLSFMAGALTD
jgi:hypothetical protein